MKEKIVVIIPAFNEEKRIVNTLLDVVKTLTHKIKYEIVVVDDGSTDRTVKLIKEKNLPHLRIISLKKNKGKGFAIKSGILSSSGDYFLFMDADNSTKIKEVFAFIKYFNQYDIIIGSRGLKDSVITKKQPFLRNQMGNLGSFVISKTLGLNYKDTQCGFKLFKANVAKEIFSKVEQDGWSFDFEVLKIAQKKDFKVLEMPITWENSSSSKVKFTDYFRTLKDLLTIYKKYR